MNKNFDWQTEDASDWDERPPSAATNPVSPGRWWLRPSWWLLAGLLLGSWLLYQQVTTQVNEAEAAATADLLASHDLLLRAAAEQDKDVVLALLSGRNTAWPIIQSNLVADGLWLERPSLGLSYQKAPTEAVSITLSADLFTAELVYETVYQTETAAPITLQQTAAYRRGVDRWLYAPPEAGYWGELQHQEYPRLTLRYRQRDADLVRRLGPDLNQAITDLCLRVEGINCPDDFRVHVEFDSHPASLFLQNRAVLPQFASAAYWYQLPTPSLIGRPLDEAGYQALSQGYTVWLLSGIVADQTDYSCCRQAAIFWALLDYQLSQMGLKAWPVDEALYRQLLNEEHLLDGRKLAAFWGAEDAAELATEEGWVAYLLVDYLLAEMPGQSPAAWQRMLDTDQELYHWPGIIELVGRTGGYQVLANEIKWYAYLQSLTQTPAATSPSPAQTLLLSCQETTGNRVTDIRLLHYTPSTEQWQGAGRFTGYPALYTAPDYSKVLFIGHDDGSIARLPQISQWQNGEIQLLSPPGFYLSTTGEFTENGRLLTVYRHGQDSYSGLLDLTRCDEATGCHLYPLEGEILWSPDGRRSLIFNNDDLPYLPLVGMILAMTNVDIRLADEQGQPLEAEPITAVRSPFWVDNETFGYVTTDNNQWNLVMLATEQAQWPLLDMPTIAQAWSRPIPYNQLSVLNVVANPFQPEQYHLLLSDMAAYHLLAYDAVAQTTTIIMTHDRDTQSQLPVVSVAGDYLLLYMVTGSSEQAFNQLFVYNMRQATDQLYSIREDALRANPFHPKSAVDGEWLAILLSERHLLLTVPHLGYNQLVVHPDLQNCQGLAWVDTAGSTAE